MKKFFVLKHFLFFISLFAAASSFAQLTPCPNGLMYSQTSPIQAFNPGLPQGPGNPVSIGVSGSSSGLAYGPNINGGTPNPTFYTIISGNYAYYNGTGWTNTGHTTGNSAAVNIGVGPGCLYNLVGGTGQIYAYYGTGPGVLLTTIAGFSGGGPYDLVVDNCCNFYLFKATAPQSLSKYSPSGQLLGQCSVVGMPNSSAGIGFAIVGNSVVVSNGSGLFIGTMTNNVVTFTNVPNIPSGGDVASCPIPCTTCGTVLPVSYKDFYCESGEKTNKIYLETAMEEYVESYSVERSNDAENFTVIGSFKANNFPGKYVFEDAEPVEKVINYYKITALERTGFSKSTYVCHTSPKGAVIGVSSVFPNPVINSFIAELDSKTQTKVIMLVKDALGKTVRSVAREIEPGLTRSELSMDGLSAGLYILEIRNSSGEFVSQQKLTKAD